MFKAAQSIDKTRLTELVRERVELNAQRLPVLPTSKASVRGEVDGWLKQLDATLAHAEAHWPVGVAVPPMGRRKGLVRRVAVPAAKAVLRVAQLVTREQREFNHAILAAARSLHTLVARVPTLIEEEARSSREGVAELRTQVQELGGRVTRLTEALADQHSQQVREAERTRRWFDALYKGVAPTESSARATGQESAGEASATPVPQLSSSLYLEFEDRFRGSREEIMGRVRAYLPALREAQAGSADREVLDIGPGRGEWLEVLKREGLAGKGVDVNSAMIAECTKLGLTVAHGDGVEYLREVPSSSLGAVTAFHVVEHLPPGRVLLLLAEAFRVLRPGGILILETPNPKNLIVGACSFYIDPTHRNPVHPDALAFSAVAHGFARVEILPLHPNTEAERIPDDGTPVVKRLNELLYGPQDYAVIGYRGALDEARSHARA
jgi:SAM-dependent methyltransferase